MRSLTCSFFGHRKIENNEELKQKVKEVIEDLIVKHGVSTFLFGSRSEFDYLCHLVVTELKEKYDIKRIAYTCKSEACALESQRRQLEKKRLAVMRKGACLLGVEEEFEHKTKYQSGKACYVERNQAMINDSDFCVFYYDKNYKPALKKRSKRSVCYYQPKSGTEIAFLYAMRKRKILINLFQNSD